VARGSETLVFYMGRKFAGEIARLLIAGGRSAGEPAAIIANAARPEQQVFITTLGGLAEVAEKSPSLAVMVIGENVKLARELNWLAKT
jgi:siroheme synthase